MVLEERLMPYRDSRAYECSLEQ